jgi:hypothetical protein
VGACGRLDERELWLISLFGGKHGAISRFVYGDAALLEIWVKQTPLVGKIGGNLVSCGTFRFSLTAILNGFACWVISCPPIYCFSRTATERSKAGWVNADCKGDHERPKGDDRSVHDCALMCTKMVLKIMMVGVIFVCIVETPLLGTLEERKGEWIDKKGDMYSRILGFVEIAKPESKYTLQTFEIPPRKKM